MEKEEPGHPAAAGTRGNLMNMLKPALILGAAALLVACGGGNNETREKQMEKVAKDHGVDADVKLDKNGEVEKVEIKKGKARVGTNLDLPDGFPKDVPVSADWKVISSTPVADGGFMIQAMSMEDVETVLPALREAMTDAGWTETQFSEAAPTMTQISFEKDDRMTNVNLIIPGSSHITLQLTTMKKP